MSTSFDMQVASLVDEASDVLRASVRDALTNTIATLSMTAFRGFLHRAYELGYREGLARGRNVEAVSGAPSPGADDVRSQPPSVGDAEADGDDVEDGNWDATSAPSAIDEDGEGSAATSNDVDWSTLGGKAPGDPSSPGEPEVAAAQRAPASFRIFPHATVHTLRARIIEAFGLERFGIDVVICRKGDANRRQLKGTVKLSKYAAERRGGGNG